MMPHFQRNLFGDITYQGKVLGCSACPMDKVPGINKVKGLENVRGRRAMLWARNPGRMENEKQQELIGPSGQLLWETLLPYGLTRNSFDVQSAVRCYTKDSQGEHKPTKEELLCCSLYNEEALQKNRQKAVVHVVLGEEAGGQLLGKDYRKDTPVLWYEPWNAYVVLQYHPSYLLRKGGKKAGWDYYEWRDRFRAVVAILEHPGRWGYVLAQDFRAVRTLQEFDEMEKYLYAEAASGRRVSLDIETGFVGGKKVLLLCGFGAGQYEDPKNWRSWKGRSYSIVLEHPEARYAPTHLQALQARTRKLVEDPTLKKSLQNGSSDSEGLLELLRANLRGYAYDTQYGTYIRYSHLHGFGLEPQVNTFLPEFADYKSTMVAEWRENFANAPLSRLVPYNGADCAVTRRLDALMSPYISLPLVQVYIHAGYTLADMETRGPLLDWENHKRLKEVIPKGILLLRRRLQQVAGSPDFNPGAPAQVAWLLYDKLKLPEIDGHKTGKEILELLAIQTGSPVPQMVTQYRALTKIDSTYLDGYATSAKKYNGQLHTIWWLTGAVTGRLRSGGGEGDAEGIVNFMNFHSNPLLLNLLVSDKNWRIALDEHNG